MDPTLPSFPLGSTHHKKLDGPLSQSVIRLLSPGTLLPSFGRVPNPYPTGFRSIRKFWSFQSSSNNKGDQPMKPSWTLYQCAIDLVDDSIVFTILEWNQGLQSWTTVATEKALQGCMKEFWAHFGPNYSPWADNCTSKSPDRSPLSDEEFFGLVAPAVLDILRSEYGCVKAVQLLQCGAALTSAATPSITSLVENEVKEEKKTDSKRTLNSAVIDIRNLNRTHRARM